MYAPFFCRYLITGSHYAWWFFVSKLDKVYAFCWKKYFFTIALFILPTKTWEKARQTKTRAHITSLPLRHSESMRKFPHPYCKQMALSIPRSVIFPTPTRLHLLLSAFSPSWLVCPRNMEAMITLHKPWEVFKDKGKPLV